MHYSETDFATIERNAYQCGDLTTAELAAAAMGHAEEIADLEERVTDAENAQAEAERERDQVRAELKTEIGEPLDALFDLINTGKRISGREEMLALIRTITEAI